MRELGRFLSVRNGQVLVLELISPEIQKYYKENIFTFKHEMKSLEFDTFIIKFIL